MKSLGVQIQELRLSCKLRLEQMANYLGIHVNSLELIEDNETYISTTTLESVQDLCSCQLDLSSYNTFDLKVIASIHRIAKNSDLMAKLLKGKTDE